MSKQHKKTRKVKYIKVKSPLAIIHLQNLVLEFSNAQLISIEVHKLCRRFLKDLQEIPLSEEFQLPINKK